MAKNKKNQMYKLLLDVDTYLSAAQLSHLLNVSKKSVYNYLDDLEYDLKPFSATLDRNKAKGIKIICDEEMKDQLRISLFNLNYSWPDEFYE